MEHKIEWAAPEAKGIMKHRSLLAWLAIAAVLLLAVVAGILWNADHDRGPVPTGSYGIEGLAYLTPISASTRDYFLEQNKGIIFTFYQDEFYIDTLGAPNPNMRDQSFSDVSYQAVPLGNELSLTNGVGGSIDLSKFTKKKAFRILSKNVDTGFSLYRLDDQVWLSYLNPDSKPQWADYLFTLKMDELQNQSAAEILNILQAADFPIVEPTVIDEDNDPGGLMGTPNGYISKAEWTDSRGVRPGRCTVMIEVFKNRADCESRKELLEQLFAYLSSDGYHFITEGRVLIAVRNGITDQQAAIYGDALKAIARGEMPEYDGAE